MCRFDYSKHCQTKHRPSLQLKRPDTVLDVWAVDQSLLLKPHLKTVGRSRWYVGPRALGGVDRFHDLGYLLSRVDKKLDRICQRYHTILQRLENFTKEKCPKKSRVIFFYISRKQQRTPVMSVTLF